MVNEDKIIRCKKCNSSQTYFRLQTEERVCKVCGFIEELNIKDKK